MARADEVSQVSRAMMEHVQRRSVGLIVDAENRRPGGIGSGTCVQVGDRYFISTCAHVATDALFDQVHVDKTELRARIRKMLHARTQVSLGELLDAHPLEQGLAELVAYMSLASDDAKAVIDALRMGETGARFDPLRHL